MSPLNLCSNLSAPVKTEASTGSKTQRHQHHKRSANTRVSSFKAAMNFHQTEVHPDHLRTAHAGSSHFSSYRRSARNILRLALRCRQNAFTSCSAAVRAWSAWTCSRTACGSSMCQSKQTDDNKAGQKACRLGMNGRQLLSSSSNAGSSWKTEQALPPKKPESETRYASPRCFPPKHMEVEVMNSCTLCKRLSN